MLTIPREPRDGVESLALKDITSMQGSVIVHQKYISGLHGKGRNVLFTGALDFGAVFQRQRIHRVGVKDFCHADFGDTAGSAIAEFASVVVCIVKPNWQSRHGVTIDGRLGSFDGLRNEEDETNARKVSCIFFRL